MGVDATVRRTESPAAMAKAALGAVDGNDVLSTTARELVARQDFSLPDFWPTGCQSISDETLTPSS